ncbi:MAG: hypothetical protein CMP81_06090 [Fulvimarina sp.]|nr:hypothetical protein [Fulvimarina sp.]
MRIIPLSEVEEPQLSPDIVWNGETGDLALSALTDPINPAGLKADQPLQTAVIIALMTDIRVDPTELRDGDRNQGWPGDGFDIEPGEQALGSKLWLLRRAALTPDIAQRAEEYATIALQPLIDQRVFVRFDITATADNARNRLDLDIAGYGREGTVKYHDRFAVLWDRLGAEPPTPVPRPPSLPVEPGPSTYSTWPNQWQASEWGTFDP